MFQKNVYQITYAFGLEATNCQAINIKVRGTFERAKAFSTWYASENHLLPKNIYISEVA